MRTTTAVGGTGHVTAPLWPTWPLFIKRLPKDTLQKV